MRKIGLHSPLYYDVMDQLISDGLGLLQFYLDPPDGGKYSSEEVECMFREVHAKLSLKRSLFYPSSVKMVVHCPHWYNLVKGSHWLVKRTVEHLKDRMSMMSKYGVHTFVLHPGYRMSAKDASEGFIVTKAQALENFIKVCKSIEVSAIYYQMSILFENIAGCRADTEFGSIADISDALRELNKSVFGWCFDSAHSYGMGESILDDSFIETYASRMGLLHFNAPDKDVEFGSHKDRHRGLLVESQQVPLGWFRRLLQSTSCDVVIERDSVETALKDVALVKEWL